YTNLLLSAFGVPSGVVRSPGGVPGCVQVLPPSSERWMICPNHPLVCEAYNRFGSAGDPFRWYISQPAKCGPLTSHFSRLPSDVRMNAPLRVPTRTRTPLMPRSFFPLFIQPNLFIAISFTPISSLQTFNIDLGHLQHGF